MSSLMQMVRRQEAARVAASNPTPSPANRPYYGYGEEALRRLLNNPATPESMRGEIVDELVRRGRA